METSLKFAASTAHASTNQCLSPLHACSGGEESEGEGEACPGERVLQWLRSRGVAAGDP